MYISIQVKLDQEGPPLIFFYSFTFCVSGLSPSFLMKRKRKRVESAHTHTHTQRLSPPPHSTPSNVSAQWPGWRRPTLELSFTHSFLNIIELLPGSTVAQVHIKPTGQLRSRPGQVTKRVESKSARFDWLRVFLYLYRAASPPNLDDHPLSAPFSAFSLHHRQLRHHQA